MEYFFIQGTFAEYLLWRPVLYVFSKGKEENKNHNLSNVPLYQREKEVSKAASGDFITQKLIQETIIDCQKVMVPLKNWNLEVQRVSW